ncbi:MAG TPA: STAS domain-containing protein [Phycisphaerales bacterium]|nr:STAS domain-containing protein [Phycisphaerales bacterium]
METASFVRHERKGPVAVARVTCPTVGQREAPIVQDEITGAAGNAAWKIIVDMSGVTVLGSMGIGMLITLNKMTREKSGKLALFGMNNDLMGVIRMTKLDKLLPIVDSEDAAVKRVM